MPRKAPARKPARKLARTSKRTTIKVVMPRGGEKEAFLDAAYEMIAHAYVRLDETGKTLTASLAPKPGASALVNTFDAAYAAARVRRVARIGSRPVETAALARALALADRVDARRREPERGLPPERLAEIAALLAEAEAAPPDPLGISKTWEQIRRGEK